MSWLAGKRIKPTQLLHFGWMVPFLTYAISYIYLAIYHKQFWLFNTIVHESGKYTLFETTFYASHFLGHIPMLLVLSFLLVGTYMCLAPQTEHTTQHPVGRIGAYMGLLLVASVLLSLWLFGSEDTWAFISQQEQNPTTYVQGGSWNLHLPSSLLLFFFMPIYLIVVRSLLHRPNVWSRNGIQYSAIFLAALFIGTAIFNHSFNVIAIVLQVCQDPRYLAHGVREMATFPLTFFPLALFLIMRKSNALKNISAVFPKRLLLICVVLFVLGMVYQVVLPLQVGIDELAQKPDFAPQGKLGILYLLSSHYFEHVLDTLFFALVSWFMYALMVRYQIGWKKI
jgi:hypothetical protein